MSQVTSLAVLKRVRKSSKTQRGPAFFQELESDARSAIQERLDSRVSFKQLEMIA